MQAALQEQLLASRLEAEMQHSEALGAQPAEQASELSRLGRELKEAEEMKAALQDQFMPVNVLPRVGYCESPPCRGWPADRWPQCTCCPVWGTVRAPFAGVAHGMLAAAHMAT